jgi:NAD(P)-dependent dehydrogenase (short-subunit alcohol dehydrogenase family)
MKIAQYGTTIVVMHAIVHGEDEVERAPPGRRGTPEEVAAWIVDLANPTASWITGQVIAVDGGLSIA